MMPRDLTLRNPLDSHERVCPQRAHVLRGTANSRPRPSPPGARVTPRPSVRADLGLLAQHEHKRFWVDDDYECLPLARPRASARAAGHCTKDSRDQQERPYEREATAPALPARQAGPDRPLNLGTGPGVSTPDRVDQPSGQGPALPTNSPQIPHKRTSSRGTGGHRRDLKIPEYAGKAPFRSHCKAVYTGSIPVGASGFNERNIPC